MHVFSLKCRKSDGIILNIDRGADATKSDRAGRRSMSGFSNSAELGNRALVPGGLTENILQTVY